MCSKNAYKNNKNTIPNLVSFEPHGNKTKSDSTFYYLSKSEEINRRSLGILNKVKELQTSGHRFDLIVCHGTAGAPLMLFDKVGIPIVSYIEFPSFKQHGWDAKYPPPEGKQLRDKNFESLSYYSVIKSDLTLVPSHYAKSMFPAELQNKIAVQMEGFNFDDTKGTSAIKQKGGDTYYVGFAARDLSSAKGFEKFIEITKKLLEIRDDVCFIIIGSEALLYSYEFHNVECTPAAGNDSFAQYVIKRENIDTAKYQFLGKLPYGDYGATIKDIDLFLYPVQFSSASWGVFELLGRGSIVIGSERCFVPEIIEDNINGFIVKYIDTNAWVNKVNDILQDLHAYKHIGETAKQKMKAFQIKNITPQYLSIFKQVIENFGR
jgi:glycosyltransferase involved in cell wall biosynthesis